MIPTGFINKENLKKGFKSFVNQVAPPKTPEQLAYEKDLRERSEKARRESYLKESIKQSHLLGRQQAKKKFGPKADPIASIDAFANNLAGGMGNNPIGKKSKLKKQMKDDQFNKLMFG